MPFKKFNYRQALLAFVWDDERKAEFMDEFFNINVIDRISKLMLKITSYPKSNWFPEDACGYYTWTLKVKLSPVTNHAGQCLSFFVTQEPHFQTISHLMLPWVLTFQVGSRLNEQLSGESKGQTNMQTKICFFLFGECPEAPVKKVRE